MRQEENKKTRKWLLPVIIAAAVLIVVGALAAVFLLRGEQKVGQPTDLTLYWNVDRLANLEEESGMSSRAAGADGLYAIRFATDGQQVEYKCADKRLVNIIDAMDVMGLVLDSDGLIVDVVDPKTVYIELAKDYFVVDFDGSLLEINSSMAMNGMPMALEIPDTAKVYDVRPDAEVVGQPCAGMEAMDSVLVYTDQRSVVTYVFLTARIEAAGVYHRVDRFYDKQLGTTRVPDEKGVYTIPFAHKGQVVELKCKDKDVVTTIDSKYYANVQMGLRFDEEGYIIETIPAPQAIRGKLLYSSYSVTEINGSTISLESVLSRNKDLGTTATMELPEDCEIYLVEDGCEAEFVGQAVEGLKIRDIINVYSDLDDVPKMIFIERRFMDSPLYRNTSTKYSSTTQETTRKVDENGYYVFDMIGEGKELKLKTKDKTIATKIDSSSTGYVGLKLSGDIITEVCTATCVCGGSSMTNRFVTESMGSIVRLVSRSDFTSGSNVMLAADCEIYDISGDYGVDIAGKTELRRGDLVTAYRNESDEICYVFILQRYYEGTKIYYNYGRTYDSTKKETKRTPDEQGYYVFEMASEGKEVTVKTKDKKMASWIDKQSPAWVALKVSGGIVKEAHKVESAVPYGRKQMNGVSVEKVQSDGNFTYLTTSGKEGNNSLYPVNEKTRIYNVSAVFNNNRGEKTKLQKNDRIYPIINCETKTIDTIMVTGGRELDSPLYYKTERRYNFTTEETTREPDADGWYVYNLAVKGEVKTFRTKDRKIANELDRRSGVFGLRISGDVIKQVYTYTYVKDLVETKVGNSYTVTAINGNVLTLTDIRPTSATKGDSIKITLGKNCQIYNVSSYAKPFGAAATPGIGDIVSHFDNKDGVTLYLYITAKNTRKAGRISMCEHCNKEVIWTPFTGTVATADTHYYLPADTSTSQLQIGWKTSQLEAKPSRVQYETVLDLNGFTLTGATRAFSVYGTLSILDTVGGGVVQGDTGTALMLSSQGGATLNLYGGTLKPGANVKDVGKGGTLHGSNCVVNLYGGTIQGGTAESGGTVYLNNSKLNIHGGTVVGGTATAGGGGAFYLLDTRVNMTGGTVVGGTASTNGGAFYLHKNATGCTMTLSGGIVTDGNAAGNGDAICVSTSATFTMTGGEAGEVYVAPAAVKAIFSGKPVVNKLTVPAETKIQADALKQGASICVNASGVFTDETENMAQYKDFFHPVRALDTIAVTENGKALSYIQYAVDGNNINNAALEFEPGTTNAPCAVCGETVTWTALDQATYATAAFGTAADGAHLYLAENITYTGEASFLAAPSTGSTACVHLNGKNITSTSSAVFFGSGGILNILGEGVVTGYNDNASTGSAVAINTSGAQGTVNLYGGTYASTADSVAYTIGLNNNGGIIRLYRAVTVNGNSRNRYIRVGTSGATDSNLYIYGATVNGRVRIEAPTGKTTNVTIENAIIKGDLNNLGGTNVSITNLDLRGNLNLQGAGVTTVSGTLTLAQGKVLNITEGAKLTLGELAEGVVIPVTATGVFTTENENAAAYLNRFTAATTGDLIRVTADGKALEYVAWNGNLADNSKLQFDEGTTDAVCPVCHEKVTWTALTAETAKLEGHMYLAGNVTYSGNKSCTEGVACLHLNGFRLESTSSRAAHASTGGTLNIMGNGTVKGVGSSYNPCSAAAWGGALNLYGGTYEGSTSRVLGMNSGGGASMAIYAGVTVKGSVLLRGTESAPATLLIAGGTIEGTIRARGAYGSIQITDGNFTDSKFLYEEDGCTGALTVNVSGGTFAFTTWYAREDTAGDLIPAITGGTFAIDPTLYVPAGFAVQTTQEGKFAVVPAPAANS